MSEYAGVASEAMHCLRDGHYHRGRDLVSERMRVLRVELADLEPIHRELAQRAYEEDNPIGYLRRSHS